MMEEDQWEQLVELEVAGRVELAGMMKMFLHHMLKCETLLSKLGLRYGNEKKII